MILLLYCGPGICPAQACQISHDAGCRVVTITINTTISRPTVVLHLSSYPVHMLYTN